MNSNDHTTFTTERPDLDAYFLSLKAYLLDHDFDGFFSFDMVAEHSEAAASAWVEARMAGLSVDQASEIANSILFEKVGDSPREIVSDILEQNFKKFIPMSFDLWQQYWTTRILVDVEGLFDNCIAADFGYVRNSVESIKDELTSHITNYLLSENAVQPTANYA